MPPTMLCMFGQKGLDKLGRCSGIPISGAHLAQLSLAAVCKPVQQLQRAKSMFKDMRC